MAKRLGFNPSSSSWPTHWSKKKQLDWYDSHFGNVEVAMESRRGPAALIKSRNKFVLDAIGNNLTKESFKSLFNVTLEKMSQLPQLTEEDWNDTVKALVNTAYRHNPSWANDGTFLESINGWSDRKFGMMQKAEIETVKKWVREITASAGPQDPSILESIVQQTMVNLSGNLEEARRAGIIPEDATDFASSFNPQTLAEYITFEATNLLGDSQLPITEDYTSLGKDVSLTELFQDSVKQTILPLLNFRWKGEQDSTTSTKIETLTPSFFESLSNGQLVAANELTTELGALSNSLHLPKSREIIFAASNKHLEDFYKNIGNRIFNNVRNDVAGLLNEQYIPDNKDSSLIDYALREEIPATAAALAQYQTSLELHQGGLIVDEDRRATIYTKYYERALEGITESYKSHVRQTLQRNIENGSSNIIDTMVRQGSLSSFSSEEILPQIMDKINWDDTFTSLMMILPEDTIPSSLNVPNPLLESGVDTISIPREGVKLVVPSAVSNPNRWARINQQLDFSGLKPELVWEFKIKGQYFYRNVAHDSIAYTAFNNFMNSAQKPITQRHNQSIGASRTNPINTQRNEINLNETDMEEYAKGIINLDVITRAGQIDNIPTTQSWLAAQSERQINVLNDGTTGDIKIKNGHLLAPIAWATNTGVDSDSSAYLDYWMTNVFAKINIPDADLIIRSLSTSENKDHQKFGRFLELYLESNYQRATNDLGRPYRIQNPSQQDPKEKINPLWGQASTEVDNRLTDTEYEARLKRLFLNDKKAPTTVEGQLELAKANAADVTARYLLSPNAEGEGLMINLDLLREQTEIDTDALLGEDSFDILANMLTPEDLRIVIEQAINPAVRDNIGQQLADPDILEAAGISVEFDASTVQGALKAFSNNYRFEIVGPKNLQLVRRLPGIGGQTQFSYNERSMHQMNQTSVQSPITLADPESFPDPNVPQPSYLARYINIVNERKDQREIDRQTYEEEGRVVVRSYTNNSQRTVTNPDILRADKELYDSIIARGEEDPTFNVDEELKRLGYPHTPELLDEALPEWLERMAIRTSLYPDNFTTSLQTNPELFSLAQDIDRAVDDYQWVRPYLTPQEAAKQDNNFKMAYTLAQIATGEGIEILKPEQSKELQSKVRELKQAIRIKREPGIAEPYTPEEEQEIQKAEETLERIETYITHTHQERAWFNANIKVDPNATGLRKVWDLARAFGAEWHPSYDTMKVTEQGTQVERGWATGWENVDFLEAAVYDDAMQTLNSLLERVDLNRATREFTRPRELADSLLEWANQTNASNREEIMDGLRTELSLLTSAIEKAESRLGVSTGKSFNNIPEERRDLVWESVLDTKQGTLGSNPPEFAPEPLSKVPLTRTLRQLRQDAVRTNNYGMLDNALENVYDDILRHYETMRITDPNDVSGLSGSKFEQMWFLSPDAISFYETYQNNPDNPAKAIRQAGLDIKMERIFEEYSVLGAFDNSGNWMDLNLDRLMPSALRQKFWQPLQDAVDRGPYSPYNMHRSLTIDTDYSYADVVRDYVTITDQTPNRQFWEFIAEREKDNRVVTQLDVVEYSMNQLDFTIPFGADPALLDYIQRTDKSFGAGDFRFMPIPVHLAENPEYGLYRNKNNAGPWADAFKGNPVELQVKIGNEWKSWDDLGFDNIYFKKDIQWNPYTRQHEIRSLGIPAFTLDDTADNKNIVTPMEYLQPEEYAGKNLRFYYSPTGEEKFVKGRFAHRKWLNIAIPNSSSIQNKLQNKESFVIHQTGGIVRNAKNITHSPATLSQLTERDSGTTWDKELKYIMHWDNDINQYVLVVQARKNPQIGRLSGREKWQTIFSHKFILSMQENK